MGEQQSFAKDIFFDIARAVDGILLGTDFVRHVKRKGVQEETSYVIVFRYRKVSFVYYVTPNDHARFAIVRAQKRLRETPVRLNADGQRQTRLAGDLTLASSVELLKSEFGSIFTRIDRQLSEHAPHGAAPKSDNAQSSQKIGVVTLPLHGNYGGCLQAFAMMETLRQLGHAPSLINRRFQTDRYLASQTDPRDQANAPLYTNEINLRRRFKTRSFIEKHITPITREFSGEAQLEAQIDDFEFDAIIVGSDQVWRPQFARDAFPSMFLGFLDKSKRDTKRIAYAASFGTDSFEVRPRKRQLAKRLLGRFDAVSVREESGVDLCKTTFGIDAQHTLDPTLLLQPSDYRKLFADSPGTNPAGITTYVLDTSDEKTAAVLAVANTLSAKAISVGGTPYPEAAAVQQPAITVEDWLSAFFNAKYVVTDSFHGVAFSILFNKPFIAFGNVKRGAARFNSILKLFDLQDRLVFDARDLNAELIQKPIDWARVNARRGELRQASLAFLRNALEQRADDIPQSNGLRIPAHIGAEKPPGDGGPSDLTANPLGSFCTGCGVCPSEAKGTLRMGWSQDGFRVPTPVSTTVEPSARRVCPFNPTPEDSVRDEDALAELFLTDTRHRTPQAGPYIGSYVGYSTAFRDNSSSGGMGTYVLDALLRRGDVRYVFAVTGDSKGGYAYRCFDDVNDIPKASKTRYFPVSLEGLFSTIDTLDGPAAVTGVACFIKAIRLKQHYNPDLKSRIPFLAGLICGGLKSRFYTDFLADSAGAARPYSNPEYRVKSPDAKASDYEFSATGADQEEHRIRMRALGDMWGSGLFKSRACDFCTDVMTELADISLGDAWLPRYNRDGRGHSVVITRSALAEEIVQEGLASGALALHSLPIDEAVRSQSGGLNHKQRAIHFRHRQMSLQAENALPVLRDRFRTTSTVSEIFVHILRERTRRKSHQIWQETRNAPAFQRRMAACLKLLRSATAARKHDPAFQTLANAVVADETGQVDVSSNIESAKLMGRWLRRVKSQQPKTYHALIWSIREPQ